MIINRNTLYSTFVGIVISLLCFEAQLFFSFLTTTRLSLLILLLLNVLLLFEGIKFSISKDFLILILFFWFIIFWATINILYHLFFSNVLDIKPLISILLILMTIIMMSLILEKNDIKLLLITEVLWIIGTLSIYLTLLVLMLKAEFNIFDSDIRLSILKRHFNDTLVSGTSRYFYGLISLNLFSIGYTFGYLKSKKRSIRILSLINVVIIVGLLIFANSRQNLLLLIFVIIMTKLMSYRITRIFSVVLKIFVISTLLFLVLNATTEIGSLIKEKYIERTRKQLNEGSERTETYRNAFDDMVSNPVFGVGLGNFERNHGITTHNGYLWVGSELGIFPLIIYLFLILWIIFSFRKNKFSVGNDLSISRLLFAYILGYLLISNNFNELFKDYTFYAIFLLYLSILKKGNNHESVINY